MDNKNLLETSMGTTVIRRDRQSKMDTLGASFAIRIAKERGDPLYKKYKKFRTLFWTIKKILVKRYGSRGLMAARKAVTRTASNSMQPRTTTSK